MCDRRDTFDAPWYPAWSASKYRYSDILYGVPEPPRGAIEPPHPEFPRSTYIPLAKRMTANKTERTP